MLTDSRSFLSFLRAMGAIGAIGAIGAMGISSVEEGALGVSTYVNIAVVTPSSGAYAEGSNDHRAANLVRG